MNTQSEIVASQTANGWDFVRWFFGVLTLAIGVVNTFWGNDPGFGVFILLLSFAYFLPVNKILKQVVGFTLPRLALLRFLLGIFILWAALGVGELFNKVELMMANF